MADIPSLPEIHRLCIPNCIAENILMVSEVCLLPMQMGIKTLAQIMNSSGL